MMPRSMKLVEVVLHSMVISQNIVIFIPLNQIFKLHSRDISVRDNAPFSFTSIVTLLPGCPIDRWLRRVEIRSIGYSVNRTISVYRTINFNNRSIGPSVYMTLSNNRSKRTLGLSDLRSIGIPPFEHANEERGLTTAAGWERCRQRFGRRTGERCGQRRRIAWTGASDCCAASWPRSSCRHDSSRLAKREEKEWYKY